VGTLLVVICCFFGSRVQHDAPSALRGLFFHSRHDVARWCVQRLPLLLLPFACCCYCPYLLFCFFYHGQFSRRLIFTGRMNSCHYVLRSLACRSAYCDPLQIQFLFLFIVSRRLPHGAPWESSRSLLVWRLTPVMLSVSIIQSFSQRAAAYWLTSIGSCSSCIGDSLL
jgi:hypothetical protein